MIVIRTPADLIEYRKKIYGKSIGFVPTMGALHQGHESLLKKARLENDICILSVFVNPTQFNNKEDLEKYPNTWDADLAMAQNNHVDVVFAPTFETMYPDGYKYLVHENDLSTKLCGAHRPGHFDGVLTIIIKLFNLVQPSKAYFGEKDYQQLSLIQGMVHAFFMPLEIIPVPTVREKDGLAMSSRNLRLSIDERKKAPELYAVATNLKSADEVKTKLQESGFKVDYVTDINNRRYIAATLGNVRLIDNVEI